MTSRIDAVMDAAIANEKIVGAELVVVRRGDLIYSRTAGWFDREAGVPMMVGTDGTGGGPTLAHELNNHVRAGVSTWDVLRMATSGNAALMGLADTGRLAPGMEADMVFLRDDPTVDVENTREVELVVTNGAPHRSDDLLAIAREIAAAARARQGD